MPGSLSRLVIKAEKQGKGPLSSLLIFPSYISYSAPANQRRELTPCPEHVQAHICVPSVTRIVLQLQFDSGVHRELHLSFSVALDGQPSPDPSLRWKNTHF